MGGTALELGLTRWLVRAGLQARDEGEVLDGLCARLVEAGVPLRRMAAGTELLHPLLDARAAVGKLATGIRVALHAGDVLYGNIGSRDRLDFTVVGPAVNEVARIEALCRSLERQVIISSAFARDAGAARARLVSLGRYALKGVRRPEELFTLDAGA
jgi:adenylate cyclase